MRRFTLRLFFEVWFRLLHDWILVMPLFMYLWFISISNNFCTLVSLLLIKPLCFVHNCDFFAFFSRCRFCFLIKVFSCLHKEDYMKYKIPFFYYTSVEILYTSISQAITTLGSTTNVFKPNLLRTQLVLIDRQIERVSFMWWTHWSVLRNRKPSC